jgi:glycine hydroxymethyltransferase
MYADVVTSTTHKTLRGPRGGIILSNNEEIIKKINRTVFPGLQGGPLMHVIAAKAICFKEAMSKSFKKYIKNVIDNASVMADTFINLGKRVISNKTETHLFLLDVKSSYNLNGLEAQNILENSGIIVNKNSIPNDELSPKYTSGIRIGSPAMTTRGFNKRDFIKLAKLIDKILTNNSKKNQAIVKIKVKKLLDGVNK